MEQQQPNMMGNGMPPQNMMMSSMQRPQSGNIEQQLHAKVMDDLRLKMGTIPPGWQTTFDIGQRANRIMQLVTGLRLLQQDPMKCIQIAENFEERTLQESPNKEVYTERMSKKMTEIHQRRQQTAVMRTNQMGMPMNNNNMGMPQNGMGNMNNMQNVGMGGQMNMNMNNMGMGMNVNMGNNNGMGMQNQMGGNGGQQNPNFPAQLQRQMQPSPIPPQQNQQPQNTLDPSTLQNPQMTQQMMQQRMNMNQNMQQQTPRPNQPQQNGNMNQMPGGPTQQEVISQAQRVMNGLPEERKTQLRNQFLLNMNEQQRAEAQKGGDPLFKFLMAKAKENLIRQRQQALSNAGAGQNGGAGAMQMGNNMGMNANAQQTPVSQPGAPNFDFSSIMGQQQNAIKLQESGEQVVPASNNPMGLGGQINVSQGVNPQQLLANQNQNNQGGNNASQMQFLAMQQQQQQRMQQEKQRQMQNQMQQQAMAQQQGQNQNQLRGQPGGLNTPNALNGGQVNSPAMNMNMLNRPMAPPGQSTPSTPQPNRAQQGMPPTPANPANQLAQHHQSMINQNNVQMNPGGQGQTPQQMIMASKFPENIKEKLINLPPHQQNQILMRIRNNPQNYAAFVHGLQNGMTAPQLLGGQQMGNQPQMMSGMPPGMSNAVPAFNSQPPPNQEQVQQGANAQATYAQRLQLHQMNMRQRAMDEGEFAKPTAQNLGIQLPPEARTWGDIKRYIQQHQAVLPPNLIEKLTQFQTQWYNAHPEDVQKAAAAFQAKMQQAQSQQQQQAMSMQGLQQQQQQQQAPPSARPPSAQAAPNGQAPPAQMVPPNAQMQGNQNIGVPNLNQMQIRTPAPEEIAMFKSKIPNAQNMTDDQIRAIMMRRLQQQRAAQLQQQQAQAQQQAQQQQNMRRAQAALGNGGQGAQAQQPQQPQQPVQQQQVPNPQGQKRQQSASDDVMEIPNPNQQEMNVPQRPGMPPNQQMPKGMPMKPPTQADMDKLDPQQRLLLQQRMKQMEALRKVQGIAGNQGPAPPQQQQAPPQQPALAQLGGGQGVPPELKALDDRIKALWQEMTRTTPKGPPIQLDSEGLEQVRNSLKRLWQPLMNLERTFYPALRAPQLGEERVKQAMRAKIIVQQNAADKDGNTKEYLAVSPQELKKHEVFVGQYFTALKELKARQDAARAQQAASGAAQAQQPPAQPAAQPAKPAAPPAPERKPSQQTRKQSAANKAPPAPTDNTKTFDWGAQSPQGVPKYDPTHGQLTQEKLKLPPQKKRRTGQQAESSESTPAAQTNTPQPVVSSPVVPSAKAQAAEQAKKMQAQPRVEAPRFKCDDSMCEGSIRGFETPELLKQHQETVHKPVEDPSQFLEEALTTAEKGLQAEKPAPAPKAAPQPRGKPMPNTAVKREGQTPDIKAETGTPARPSSSFGKAAAKPTPTLGKKGADAKAPDSAIEVVPAEQEKTLQESMAAKISFPLPVCEAPQATEAPFNEIDDLFDELFLNTAPAPDGSIFINDWNDLGDVTSITDWGLRPSPDPSPELTPSDGTSQSSRESDISQSERLRINFEWDPFGNGDTGVPEVLMQTQRLGLGEGADAGAEKKDGEWDWKADMMDWDSLFGANAGLDGDVMGEGMVF